MLRKTKHYATLTLLIAHYGLRLQLRYTMNTTVKKCDKRWFKSKLADKDMTQAALARHLGMDTTAVSRMLNGDRKFQLEEAGAVAKVNLALIIYLTFLT